MTEGEFAKTALSFIKDFLEIDSDLSSVLNIRICDKEYCITEKDIINVIQEEFYNYQNISEFTNVLLYSGFFEIMVRHFGKNRLKIISVLKIPNGGKYANLSKENHAVFNHFITEDIAANAKDGKTFIVEVLRFLVNLTNPSLMPSFVSPETIMLNT